LYSLVDVARQAEDGGIVYFWHLGQEGSEFFLVTRQDSTETDLPLGIESEEVEIFA
jgi:hypothetical protein